MVQLDPLSLTHNFFQAGEIAKKKEQKSEKTKSTKKSFASILETSQAENVNEINVLQDIKNKDFAETLQYLVDSVYEAGDRLKKNPFADEFKSYRQSLSHFLQFVVKNSYEVETLQKQVGRRRGQKPKVYTIVQVINEKLDNLAAGILFNQADQLKILASVEEINGLIVDFFS